MTPRPENWDAVNALANNLEPAATVAAVTAPPTVNPTVAPVVSEIKTQSVVRPVVVPKPVVVRSNPSPPPRLVTSSVPTVAKPKVEPKPEPVVVASPEKIVAATVPPTMATEPPVVSAKSNPVLPEKYAATGVTPLPPAGSGQPETTPLLPPKANPPAPTPPVEAKPVKILPAAPPLFTRYLYLSPRKPAAGDRVAASFAFSKAREFEQSSRWTDAMEWYRRATEADASWFEAQYNYGVLAYRLRNFTAALSAYETALAIQPGSTDARYNFALALKSSGYATDAVNELEKILATNADEVRAQLALGNLYAQQLHNPAAARKHYLKVLALDPRNPQANDIRFWLSANPA